MHETKDFRQPFVTSLGIIMGFLLGFLGKWTLDDNGAMALYAPDDLLVAATTILGVILMLIVLYRMLTARYDPAQGEAFYMRTLRLYMVAVAISFFGVAFILLFA